MARLALPPLSTSWSTTGGQLLRRVGSSSLNKASPSRFVARSSRPRIFITRRYYREQEDLIKRVTGASKVIVLNNIVRNAGRADDRGSSNPFAGGGNGINGYANVVHTDFRAKRSVEKFYEQLPTRDSSQARNYEIRKARNSQFSRFENYEVPSTLQPESGIHGGKWMLLNTWRNISDSNPIYNNTLACCDQQSVSSPDDFVSVDVPLRRHSHAEQYRLASHSKDKHLWYYFPRMTKDEVLIFTQFDSDPKAPARFCFHTRRSTTQPWTQPFRSASQSSVA